MSVLSDTAIVAIASRNYADDDLVIDREAYVDRTEEGAWVDARVWVDLDPQALGNKTTQRPQALTIPQDAWRPTGEYLSDDPASSRARLKTTISINGLDMHLEAYAIDNRDENDNSLTAEETLKRYEDGSPVFQHLLDGEADDAIAPFVGDAGWPIREATIAGRAYCLIATPCAR